MGLRKGQTNNPNGRQPGSKNKKTAQWEALAESITGEQAEKFSKYINKLWNSKDPENQEKAAELFLKTVEYFKPKQARVESNVTIDSDPITFVLPKE